MTSNNIYSSIKSDVPGVFQSLSRCLTKHRAILHYVLHPDAKHGRSCIAVVHV